MNSRPFYHLLFSACLCNICLTADFYTNNWAVQLAGTSAESVERISRKYGFINMGKIFTDSNYYHMKQRAVLKQSFQTHLHSVRLRKDPMIIWFAQQSGKSRKKRHSFIPPSDPLFHKQWHLSESFGHNIVAAWTRGYTGKGVVVSVLDDGIEKNHQDLAGNYDPAASYDINDIDPNPDPHRTLYKRNRHGTRCAGQIASVANNSVCGVGVAYHAKIGGIRMLDGDVTDLIEAKSLIFNQHHIDIYSSSWGPPDTGSVVDGPGLLSQEALIRGVSQGRGGLGSIFIWASGNGGMNMDNCNCDGYVNSIYTVAISSTTNRADVPSYSEPCAAVLTTTYSGGNGNQERIVTTDLNGACTTDHTGTSASAPLAAGIIALALEANPTLTWRDVQHLVVRASRRHNLKAEDWTVNGAGRNVSHYYGYGLLDAGKLVGLARNWSAVNSQKKCQHVILKDMPVKIGHYLRISWNETACRWDRNRIRSLEHVQAQLSLKHVHRGDLTITLLSPAGTPSNLLTRRHFDRSSAGFSGWNFMSTRCWDEDPTGVWSLIIRNTGDRHNIGELTHLHINLYGTDEHIFGRRMERTMIHQCTVRNNNGSCKDCPYPLYIFENICVVACPPHFYELDSNSSTYPQRHCLPCHRSCETCSGPEGTHCLDCPPHSTFNPQLGMCSSPNYRCRRA
ncbi:proprotein convertase subtilisin/kexin type 4-like isoform X1 [Alosa sapidissima]|uniref:proprotein convertase subtilisin/kexin type 4-like isoform X1 n=1 Tax=Alosa sapidissima TaxID=34773 RepID=UPI001C098B31|nr:proprotein convertase subtilisin/kexin type 4-like isoform X1 [Alosa sapidissima]